MKKELGKWLMDVAKYIVTAVVLSSFFGDVEKWIVYIGGILCVIVMLWGGLYLSTKTDSEPKNYKINKSKRNK